MDTMNTTAKESRKKYLAPLLVLLLCAVSLTGAAYAYVSSVGIVGNNVNADEYVLQVYEDTNPAHIISEPITFEKVTFYPVTNVVKGEDDTVTVKADAGTLTPYIGMLTIKATGVTGGHKITASVEPSKTSGSVDVAGTTGALGFTIAAGLYTDEACSSGFVSGVTDVDFAAGVATLYYKVTVAMTGTGIVFANATPEADNLAVKNAFVTAATFDLTFSATGPIA